MTIASGQPSMPSPSSLSRCSAQPSLTFFHCWISMSFLSLVMGMVLATVAGGTLKDEEWWMMLLVQHEQSVYFEWLWCDFMKDIHDDKLIHREPSTQSRFYTQKPLHRTAFTQNIYKQKPLHTHTEAYTEKLLQREAFYTEQLLHRKAFEVHRSIYTQEAFTQRCIYTQKPLQRELLHTEAFTQTLSQNQYFTSVLTFDHHVVRKGCVWSCKSKILHQFLSVSFDLHFERKGCIVYSFNIASLQQFLTLDHHFVRGCTEHFETAR